MKQNVGEADRIVRLVLGAAIIGKAACLGIHPYQVDTSALGVTYRQSATFSPELVAALQTYRKKWMQLLDGK